MEQPQTIRFTSTCSTSGQNNIEEVPGESTSLNMNSQTKSFAITGSDITIKVDPTTHTSGSSAVVTRNITNYSWDLVYIPGNLVAVHCSGNFIAYAIIAPSSTNGIVRIISRRTGVRGLIKNIPGFIKDLSFAYLSNRILLAFTDEHGSLFVYEVQEEEKTLKTDLLVNVEKNESEEASDFQRVIWCPYIPENPEEEQDEENLAYLLVVTNGPLAEIWHIMSLIQVYGTGCIQRSQLNDNCGHQVLDKHTAPISDAAFSPDGTALATASLDGFVKFFQVYTAESPRCLHEWNPHNGKPLSCLFFLDNHKNPSPDVQFWKYAVTGACDNTEIKTWSCAIWQMNQVIKFELSDEASLDSNNKLALKAAIDPSSKYLILSDIYRRVLHVLILHQEPAVPEAVTNGETAEPGGTPLHTAASKCGVARIVSITELPIQYPAVFLAITDADWKPYKRWKLEQLCQDGFHDNHDEADDDNDNIDIVEGLVLKCVLINTKSLQDATVRFQPTLPTSSNFDRLPKSSSATKHNLSTSQESNVIKDGLTDLSLNLSTTLSEMDNSLCGNVGGSARKPSSDLEALEKDNLLVSLAPSSVVTKTILAAAGSDPLSVSTSSTGMISKTDVNPPVPSLASPLPIGNSQECAINSQPITLNLLTPESFSSPGRVEEDDSTNKDVEVPRTAPEPRERFAKSSPSPSEDFESAALSLMLRVTSSSSRLPSSEVDPVAIPCSSLPSERTASKNILETVVAGSSISPPVVTLPPPPPPRAGPSPLLGKDDAPLATSEVSPHSSAPRIHPCEEESIVPISGGGGSTTVIPTVGSSIGLASSTSSPSLEVQQILHSHHNKADDDFADEDEDGIEGGRGMKLGSSQKTSSRCQSLQELINITAASKHDPQNKTAEQSPLIDMFASLKNVHSPTSNHLAHLIGSGLKQTSPLCDTSVANVTTMSGTIPVPSMMFVSKDSNNSLPLIKGLSAGKSHLTCEELEAEMKSSSPTLKKSSATMEPSLLTSTSSATSLSGLDFPMNSRTSTVSHVSSTKEHTRDMVNISMEAEALNRFNKTLEEIKSLRQLILSCDNEQEEKSKLLMEQMQTLSTQMDKSQKSFHQINKSIEDLRKSQNRLNDQIPQIISSTAKPIIENCLRQEVRNSLPNAISKFFEPVRSQLMSEIRNLVANSENHLSDSLTKTACSRSFIDNVSTSVSSALSVSVQSACRESYNKVVVPGFNAIVHQVFSQLNDAFTRGTKEYMQHVENESQSTRNALLENVSSSSRTLETTSNSLSSHVSALIETLHKNVAQQTTLSETLGERLRHLVHDEVARALQEHYAVVEARTSRAQTPAPVASTLSQNNPKMLRQQVQQLISQGHFNLAFKQALCASDLSLVMFVCERINPQHLFSQSPCPLTQDVLLSLVNQLSHDLTTFTDLKTKYLEEAIVNLDTNHPVTREHMRKVLQEFQRTLGAHLEQNPNHKKLKVLLLAVNHLVTA